MATLNELAYDLLNKLEGGRSTHNSYISLDQIKFNINYYRSLLIHRDIERTSLNRESFEQRINVSLEITADSDLSDIKFFVRSIDELPKIVRANHRYLLNVYNTTTDKVYPVNNYHRMKYTMYNQFTKDASRAYLLDNYLYLHKNLLAEQLEELINSGEGELSVDEFNPNIVVRGIFEDPREVHLHNGVDPEEIDDKPYPISGDMIQRINQSIINGNLELIQQMPNDTKHNTLPDHQLGGQ